MLSTQFKFDAAKRLFFDSPAVLAAMNKKERGVLSRAGRFVQRKARGLIRKRKKPSKPGQSPTNQTGIYRSSILFFADLDARSVIIGPTALNGRKADTLDDTLPATLETGGRSRMPDGKVVNIAARPHMLPAFEAELPKFPDLFRGQLTS